jgi:hypothetical protein
MEDRLEKLKQKTLMLSSQEKMAESNGFRASRSSFNTGNVY